MKPLDTSKCPACSLKWVDHLGLIGVCSELQLTKRELKEIKDELVQIKNKYNNLLLLVDSQINRKD